MNKEIILGKVDHTFLKPFATYEDIQTLCEEAIQYHTASVCIPPCFVKGVYDNFGDKIAICTVIGFPLGYSTIETKKHEAAEALKNGASEIDMVINIGQAKEHDFEKVTAEIKDIKNIVGPDRILKVIVETCYLTDEEKICLCKCVTDAGADYIKTSTGFGTGGATFEDVRLLKANVGPQVKVKAAGGMRTVEDIINFSELGADRLGTSLAISLLKGL